MKNRESLPSEPTSLLGRCLQIALLLGASLGVILPLLRSRRKRRREGRAGESLHVGE